MLRFMRYGLCFASFAAMTLLVVSVRKHGVNAPHTPRPINEWDIPELAVHLNRVGVHVQLWAVPKNGPLNHSAFLTSTAKEWRDLNVLSKDPRRVQEWNGTLYCERIGENDATHLLEQWGEDHCLAVGPFLLYGDAKLLERVRAALAESG